MLILSIKVKVAIRVKNKLKIQNNDESLQVSRKCQPFGIFKKLLKTQLFRAAYGDSI
jgi:hypothetical protein